jgi:type II secretory pathway predicted ATPase ExeA
MASIMYGVMENRGFTALIAPPGMGKTTLLFDLLQRCGEQIRTVFLFQFQPSPEGLLRSLLAELGISDDGQNFVGMQEKLNQAILAEAKRGRRIVVIVDEAQNFREPVLEVLRMLSNFETIKEKLLHIILSGQPQLAEMLNSPSIQQLRQRISIVATLQPLDAVQTKEYIGHRLRIAGYVSTRPLFSEAAYRLIAEYSAGIPRTINNLCFGALSIGCAMKRTTIGPEVVNEAIRDLDLLINSPTETGLQSPRPAIVPHIHSSPVVWPPQRPAGRALRNFAGLAAIIAALSVGGSFASRHLKLESVTAEAPPPPSRPAVPEVALTQTPVEELALQEEPATPATLPQEDSVHKETRIASSSTPQPPRSRLKVKLVTVSSSDTLYGVCRKNMNDCSPLTLQKIRELNPSLRNVKSLAVGDKVRMPMESQIEVASAAERTRSPKRKVNSGENR